jgi:hypothetical protein
LNFNGTGGTSSLNIGPIVPATGSTFNGFTLTVASVLGAAGNHVDLAMAASGFSGAETITVNALDVGTTALPMGSLPDRPPTASKHGSSTQTPPSVAPTTSR